MNFGILIYVSICLLGFVSPVLAESGRDLSEYAKMMNEFNEPSDNNHPGAGAIEINNSLPPLVTMTCASSKEPDALYHGVLYPFTESEIPDAQRAQYKDSKLFINLNISLVSPGIDENPYQDIAWRKTYRGGAIGLGKTMVAEGTTRPIYKDEIVVGPDGKRFFRQKQNGEPGNGISFNNTYALHLSRYHKYMVHRLIQVVDEKSNREVDQNEIFCAESISRNIAAESAVANPDPKPSQLELSPELTAGINLILKRAPAAAEPLPNQPKPAGINEWSWD